MRRRDRKSTRLNSSHLGRSYAVFCSCKHCAILSFPTRRSSDLDDRNAIAVLVNIRTGGTRFGAPEAGESYNVCASRDRNSWHATLVAVPRAAWAGEG